MPELDESGDVPKGRSLESLDTFDSQSAAMLIIDPDDGSIVRANQAAAEFYGWPVATLETMRIPDINTSPHELVISALGSVRDSVRKTYEFRHRMADGSVKDVRVFTSAMRTGGKALIHSIITDITARSAPKPSSRARYPSWKPSSSNRP